MRTYLLFWLLIIFVVASRQTKAQGAFIAPASAAILTVEASSRRFILGEPARVRVTLRATGKEPLTVPANLRGFWGFQATAPSGQVFYGRAGNEVCPIDEEPEGSYTRVLSPGSSVVYDTDLIDEVPELFASSGTHKVVLKVESIYAGTSKNAQVLLSAPIHIRFERPTGVNARAYAEMLDWVGGDARKTGGLLADFAELSQRILDQYPDSVYAKFAHQSVANEYLRLAERVRPVPEPGKLRESTTEHLQLSKSHYQQVLSRYPAFQFRGRLRLRFAKVLYLLGDSPAAIRQIETLLKEATETDAAEEAQELLRKVRGV